MKSNSGLLNVIVTFNGESAPTNENVNLLKALGINTGITMQSLPIAGVLATNEQINALAVSEQVRSIYLNREVQFYNADATELTGVNKVRVDDDMRKANGGLPVSGKGVGVIINDSGVDGTHPDLKLGKNLVQNVLGTTNMTMFDGLAPVVYLEDVANTDTNSGHGTHVAGTVGGTGQMSSGLHAGVAPGADLIGYGSGGVVFILDMIGGFDYAITNQFKHNIRVITNSWGTNDDFFPDDPVNVASKRCYDRGIVVLFAAGNSGPEEDTHNPYAKAPWVISVAAGKKDGTLVNFSSRGTRGVGETFEVDGETWTWKDEPTITAPGVDIVSTRVIAPLGALSATKDINLDPAHVPFYAHMSGTSMATPHAAGIVTLLLEANPLLSPMDVKEILQKTATNMPGRDAYEVGAGYVNAYAAVDLALNEDKKYGNTLTIGKKFNAYTSMNVLRDQFEIDYSLTGNDSEKFNVMEGQSQLVVKVYADGDHPTEEGGNPVGFTITDPNGVAYGSGINLLYSIDLVDTITVDNPVAGEWTVTIEPYAGIALPEKIVGTITQKTASIMTGLTDIAGHPAEGAIVVGINERLFDAMNNGEFKPNEKLTRLDLATYLTMGAGIRQVDQLANDAAVNAVIAQGASLKGAHKDRGVMLLDENGRFNEKANVTRAELAYSLVQSLGLQNEAENFSGTVTVSYKGEALVIEDEIPAHLKGYVQLALNLGIMNAYFTTSQGPYDLEPTLHATYAADESVTRAQFAVAMTRFFNNYK
ncbi:peptidase S8 [Lottiidibacillus patelloidae]|uniref:Peptidase S8 n=2 Tax=Lottiidibacillus patelloidae TaxID=2670334 RepID=A0A263BSK3_9BACI|nr:peptidase S8 [Lottiidibacillus patelloidae]